MGLELIINGLSLDCNDVTDAKRIIAAIVLSKVIINSNGKKLIPVISFKEDEK